MRVRDVLVLGALTIGAMACGDSLAPEAREGKDLAFVLPAAEGELPSARSYSTWNEPVSESEIAKVRATQQAATLDGSGDGDAILPVIFSRYAVGEFVDNFTASSTGCSALEAATPCVRTSGSLAKRARSF